MGAKITDTSPPCDIGLDDIVGNHRPISSVYNITNLSLRDLSIFEALDRDFQELLVNWEPGTSDGLVLAAVSHPTISHLAVLGTLKLGLLLSTSCLIVDLRSYPRSS